MIPNGSHFATTDFQPIALTKQAISVARTRSLTGGKKLVIVENCHLKQWGDTELETLQQLVQVPEFTILVFVATNVDKRLKIYKHLVKYAKLLEFPLIPSWRTDLIDEKMQLENKILQAIEKYIAKFGIEYPDQKQLNTWINEEYKVVQSILGNNRENYGKDSGV